MKPRPNRKTGKVMKCFTCNKEIYVEKHKLSLHKSFHCSRKCQQISPLKRKAASDRMKKMNKVEGFRSDNKHLFGRKPWNYIDGSSRNRKYNMLDWKEVAKKVYFRDRYKCTLCEKKNVLLNAHHMKPWAGNPESRFDLSNIITLCVPCHTKVHQEAKINV